MKEESQRTLRQNRALHKYCTLLAETLNDAGLDCRKVMKEEMAIPWSMTMVKDLLWRPVQKALTEKESTTEMNTADPGEIYEVLNRHLGEKFGVIVDWPSDEPPMIGERKIT